MAIVGIDLGTTNSCISIIQDNRPVVIPNEEGSRVTPSVVAFTEGDGRIVGAPAKRQAPVNPSSTVFSIKRLIGRKVDSENVKKSMEILPFLVVPDISGDACVRVSNNTYSVQEISSIILTKMKDIAEDYLGYEVKEAVVTVPAHFNDVQRQATKDAGRIAGFNVRRIINEPTAAALAYGFNKESEGIIAAYDLGGGTFDITILEVKGGVFSVRATSGDAYLGGNDFDQKLIEYVVGEFKGEHNIDLKENKITLQKIGDTCEKAKHELSFIDETSINLPFIAADSTGAKHLNLKISRAKLEELVEDLITRLESPCKQVLKDAGLSVEEIDEVILVGGMTRMPRVKEKVKEIFGKEPQTKINPEEAVAIGAAIQGHILEGKADYISLVDVIPLSLGVETKGGLFTKIIEKNTKVPTKRSRMFTTTYDNQDFIDIHVLQGEREMVSDNVSLARFTLTDIPLAPKGVPEIEVLFEVDEDCILQVFASDLITGSVQKVKVENSGGLSDSEIKKLIQENKESKERDMQKKKVTLLKNRVEGVIYSINKALTTYGDRIDAETKLSVKTELESSKALLNEDDYSSLDVALKSLQDVSYKLAQIIYSKRDQSTASTSNMSDLQ